MESDIIEEKVAIIWQGNNNRFTESLKIQSNQETDYIIIDSYEKFHTIFLEQLKNYIHKQFKQIILLAELDWKKNKEQEVDLTEFRGLELAQLLRLEYAVLSPILICSFLQEEKLEHYFSFKHFDSISSLGANYVPLPLNIFMKSTIISDEVIHNKPSPERIKKEVLKVIFSIKGDYHNDSLLDHLVQINIKLIDLKDGIKKNILPDLIYIEGILKFIYRTSNPNFGPLNYLQNPFKTLINYMNRQTADNLRNSILSVGKYLQENTINIPTDLVQTPIISSKNQKEDLLSEELLNRTYSRIHILYFPERTYIENSLWEHQGQVKQVGTNKHLFITIFYEHHLEPFLTRLSMDDNVTIWIHYNRGGNPNNLQGSRIVFEKYKYLKKYFITSGAINTIKQELKQEYFLKSEREESSRIFLEVYSDKNASEPLYKIFSNTVFTGEDVVYLPHAQQIKKILDSKWDLDESKITLLINGEELSKKMLLSQINEYDLKIILSNVIKNVNHYEINVLQSGFSGAFAIAVNYTSSDTEKNVLLKIDSNLKNLNQEKKTKEYIKNTALENQNFVFADDLKLIKNWYISQYTYKKGKSLFSSFRNRSIKKIESTLLTILDKFKVFGYTIGHSKLIDEKIWVSNYSTKKYKGLIFLNTLNILKEIKAITTNNILFEIQEIELVNQFIAHGDFQNIFNSKKKIPTARVHGDFHSGNILIDDTGKHPTFIDFALTPKEANYHAFYDLAKLSVNLELLIIEDSNFLLGGKTLFYDWISLHLQWLKELNNPNFSFYLKDDKHAKGALKKIYSINVILKKKALEYTQKLNCPEEAENFAYQFEIVRLHFFLKSIAYTNLAWQKRLFALKASLNIINYFKKENPYFQN